MPQAYKSRFCTRSRSTCRGLPLSRLSSCYRILARATASPGRDVPAFLFPLPRRRGGRRGALFGPCFCFSGRLVCVDRSASLVVVPGGDGRDVINGSLQVVTKMAPRHASLVPGNCRLTGENGKNNTLPVAALLFPFCPHLLFCSSTRGRYCRYLQHPTGAPFSLFFFSSPFIAVATEPSASRRSLTLST